MKAVYVIARSSMKADKEVGAETDEFTIMPRRQSRPRFYNADDAKI